MNERSTIEAVNQWSREEFVRVIGPVFEHSPWIADETWAKRPFVNSEALHADLCDTARGADVKRQLDLIRAHPDLVGRAALAGTLTAASTSEQSSAGLSRLTAEEIALFQKCNDEYRAKFGFPFVICARLNKKETILKAFPIRVAHSLEEEIRTALEEIFKIADFRLKDLVTE